MGRENPPFSNARLAADSKFNAVDIEIVFLIWDIKAVAIVFVSLI